MIAAGKKNRLKMKYPDEAVALPASDTGGPERDCDPDDRKQDPPEDGHDRLLSAFVRNARACCRPAASAPSTLPHRAILRTTRASPREG